MVEAYLFFFDRISDFFLGTEGEQPIASDVDIADRLDKCFQSLRSAISVVVIDLHAGDDPQVIFETLNARGEPLLPADLLRNYIFFRAGKEGLDIESAYGQYWAAFDEEFWREEVRQGRLSRPRSDLFMQHFLASRQGRDIPVKHLYVEYRHWIEREKPFDGLEEELSALSRQGTHFRRIIEPTPDDIVYELCAFLEAYDIRTAYPLLLALLEAEISGSEWREIARCLESYLIRRAICNLGTKNYNRIFLSLTRNLRAQGVSAEKLKDFLLAQEGESGLWPDDARVREAWLTKSLYGPLNNAKLVWLFGRLNQTYMSSKSEALAFAKQPSIEHIMPQDWIEHWPLADGSTGLEWEQLYDADEDDPVAQATRDREAIIHTLGNLTILSDGLNTAQSNLPWSSKLPELVNHSLLPINQALFKEPEWNETTIAARGASLFERARRIWPR